MFDKSTAIPNIFFDKYLRELTGSEVLILLYIMRQTYGWKDPYTGNRKQRDWINQSQFEKKTGLSRKTISTSIDSLIQQDIILATDYDNNNLKKPEDRVGKTRIYYSPFPKLHVTFSSTQVKFPQTKEKFTYNKKNSTERNLTKKNFPTPEKNYAPHQRIPDHVRMAQIIDQQHRQQMQRDNWER